jgi:DNA-binding MarR family transcriptional regulator
MNDTVKKKNRNYKAINTTSAKDTKLTLKAKGVMFYLLSKPDGWRGQVYDIVVNCNVGRDAVKAALKELRDYNYVELIRQRDNSTGRITSYYVIHDQPKKKQ